ncbi:MAG TPA: MazG family protein [Streptosporangiaceae bacterium]|nr:MazG family protein [Streptosporangiaceae bacterium]
MVLAPAGHPQLPPLEAAGIRCEIVPSAPDAGVWLAPPGADGYPGADVVIGSSDLPGAHLLDLVATMERLRAECPWDAQQTHLTLAPHLLEEPYEALEALEAGDMTAFREELGDVLLQVVFHARIADDFNIDGVADAIVEKLVRRHPHVFGSVTVADADEVKRNWDEIKKQERSERALVNGSEVFSPPVLDGVPFGQPALALAAQLQRRAARAGVPEELSADPGVELGAELFGLVTKARLAGLDPELELRAAARRYRDRVQAWERSHPLYGHSCINRNNPPLCVISHTITLVLPLFCYVSELLLPE